MKSMKKGAQKINKGTASGIVISMGVHALVFFLAGLFIVFRVMNPPPPEFEPPPPIERPKMKLKKPQVKVKKSSTPRPSSRIVAQVKTKEMPEIQLPDLMGTGEGLMGGVGLGGEFMDLPEIQTLSLLGSTETSGNDLIGTYYDLKRTTSGNAKVIDKPAYLNEVLEFIQADWNMARLGQFYQLPQRLYMTTLIVPTVPSNFAPVAFGDSDAAEGGQWLIHYKGQLVHREGITFRFWAAGDFFIIVRIDGEIVVASVWDSRSERQGNLQRVVGNEWSPSAAPHRQYICGRNALAAVGDWVTLEPGVARDIEILVGDEGGLACAYLLVEEEGVDYPTSSQGGPVLPAFKTAKISHDMLDVIYPYLPEDEMVSLTNGPVFNDL